MNFIFENTCTVLHEVCRQSVTVHKLMHISENNTSISFLNLLHLIKKVHIKNYISFSTVFCKVLHIVMWYINIDRIIRTLIHSSTGCGLMWKTILPLLTNLYNTYNND